MKLKFTLIFAFIYFTALNIYPQWYTQQSGTTDLLYSIQFTDADNGWVTDLNGIKLFHTTNGGIDWFVQKDFGVSTIWNFTFLNNSTGYFYSRDPGNLMKTTDGGSNWQLIYTFGPTVEDVKWYDENTGWCIVLSLTTSLIKTTDGGVNWQGFDYFNSFDGLLGKVGIINENTVIVTGSHFNGDHVIFKTTDGGTSWTEIPVAANLLGGRIQFVNDNIGWIESSGLNKTTDGGMNWELQVSSVYDFYFINENVGWYIYGNQIKKTTDGGLSWVPQNSGTNNTLYTIDFIDQDNGWISGDSGTILHTINGGTPVELVSFNADVSGSNVQLSWMTAAETNNNGFEIQRSEPDVQNPDWKTICFMNGNGTTTEPHSYSFTDEHPAPGKYNYRLKQIDFNGSFEYSKVIEAETENPDKFALEQNYPNPFNPTTTINYQLPRAEFVTIKIYDVMGREVKVLVNEQKDPGSYSIEFDASKLTSGIYVYQLTAGSFLSSRKLLLLK